MIIYSVFRNNKEINKSLRIYVTGTSAFESINIIEAEIWKLFMRYHKNHGGIIINTHLFIRDAINIGYEIKELIL